SSCTTLSPLRCRPRARTVAFWSRGGSITLRRWVSLSLATGAPPAPSRSLVRGEALVLGPASLATSLRGSHGVEHGLGRDLVHFASSQARDLLRPPEVPQPGYRRVDDVDRIARPQGLGQDVGDPGALHDGPHRPTGDDPRSRRG